MSEITYGLRQIILDRWRSKNAKPSRRDLKAILKALPPDTVIIGYGYYGFAGMLYLTVESALFDYKWPLNLKESGLTSTVSVIKPPAPIA